MKQIWKIAVLVLGVAVFLAFVIRKDDEKDSLVVRLILMGLDQSHFAPKKIDDNFSEKLFDQYIEALDYNKRFFSKADIDLLVKYRHNLDEQLMAGSFQFFNSADSLMSLRVRDVEGYYQEALGAKFDFKIKESIEFDDKKLQFAASDVELKDRWRKTVKYEVLTNLDRMVKDQEVAPKGDLKFPIDTLEANARARVLKNYDSWFKRMKQLERADRMEQYMNVITGLYDPHSNYFPPKSKEDYDIGMSGRLEGIGATLQQADGYIKIIKLQPGSPSWKDGRLTDGDLILKVAQGNAEPVDVVDMRLDEAVQLIRGPKGSVVKLTIKKRDGALIVVDLVRDVVNVEETFAKSAVMELENEKYGYVYLPKFYADFDHKDGRSCATDVEIELKSLIADGVMGIVLDLRNNGGGSLQDVVDMTGLFIRTGPVVQVKSREATAKVMSDTNPKQIWNGGLVILVNEMSASASEIIAAAIQDYGRGIIMGSSTFGKGTVQRFLSFDDVIGDNYSQLKPLGAMKLTTQKFYRINGSTTQLKGVEPDVLLPDAYTYIPVGEKEQENALPWDVISATAYQQYQPEGYSLKKVIAQMQSDLKKNTNFRNIDKGAQFFKKRKDDTSMTLNYEDYKEQMNEADKTTKKLQIPTDFNNHILFSAPTKDKLAATDTMQQNERNMWFKNLKKDPYLEQAVRALQLMK